MLVQIRHIPPYICRCWCFCPCIGAGKRIDQPENRCSSWHILHQQKTTERSQRAQETGFILQNITNTHIVKVWQHFKPKHQTRAVRLNFCPDNGGRTLCHLSWSVAKSLVVRLMRCQHGQINKRKQMRFHYCMLHMLLLMDTHHSIFSRHWCV